MTHPGGAKAPMLVTGAAGFIGFHVARALLDAGTPVIGVDSMNASTIPGSRRRACASLRTVRTSPSTA